MAGWDGEGEDGVCCRICRLSATEDNVLFSPCKCSGSIKYVHQECLISWLNHSGHQHCELCRHRFEFRPVYAPNAPSRLPWIELVWGLAGKSLVGLALAARVLAVVLTWLFAVPLLTCWMWRLAFLTSLSQGVKELGLRLQPVLILADCIQGSLISSALILMVLLATYTAEQIRAYWQILQPHPPPAEPRLAMPVEDLRAHAVEDQLLGPDLAGEDIWQEADESAAWSPDQGQSAAHQEAAGGAAGSSSRQAEEAAEAGIGLARRRRVRGARSQGDLPSLDRSEEEQLRAELQLEAQAHRQGQERRRQEQENQARAGLGFPRALVAEPPEHGPAADNDDEAQRQEREFAFNELIGLQGPINLLLENAATVLFTIWAFMTAALWMPFMLGRTVVPTILAWKERAAASGAWAAAAPHVERLLAATSQFRALQALAARAPQAGPEAEASWEGGASRAAIAPLLRRLAQDFEAHLSGPGLNDWVCLGVGYSVLAILATLGFVSLVVWKLLWHSNLREGWRGRRDVIRAALADVSNQTRLHLGYAAVLVKVSLVLVLELTLLPALNGCWVDLCLLPVFGSSWADRMQWLKASPLSFLLLHWVVGMAVLMAVATFLSIVRQQLRPGALPFFRDPYEGDDEPMRALMTLGLGQQLEREAYAFSCLACLAVLLLHLPLRITKAVLPGVLPLKLNLGSPFIEAPTDLLLFHFLLPLTIPRLRLRQTVLRGVRFWLKTTSRLLGVDDYLLPRPAGEAAAADQQPPPQMIPLGFPAEEETAGGRWQQEMEAARNRSGQLLALLAALLGTLILLHTLLLNLPLLAGKLLFSLAGLPTQHDVYNAACGAYALWGVSLLGRQVWRLAGARSVEAAAEVASRWARMLAKLGGLGLLALGALPALLGVFMELALMPFRLHGGETPVFFIYQDWAVGLLLLRLTLRCLLGWARGDGEEQNPALARDPSPSAALKRFAHHFRRLQRQGLARLGFKDAFRHVVWPPLACIATAVAMPYVLARGLGPRLPLLGADKLQTAFVWAWAGEAAAVIAVLLCVKAAAALERLGSRLRDQRYLLHRELVNVSE